MSDHREALAELLRFWFEKIRPRHWFEKIRPRHWFAKDPLVDALRGGASWVDLEGDRG